MAITRTGLLILACCLAYGQAVDKALTFEAATVKPATPPVPDAQGRIMMMGPSGGPGTKDPGRIRYPYLTLKNLLTIAYDVKTFQVSGPAFLDTDRFDVVATMAPDTTKEQFRLMLQNLLAERFKLTIHRESKELPMYSLVVGKGGPKMKESEEARAAKDGGDAPPAPPMPSQPKIGADGFPILPLAGRSGIFAIMMAGRGTRLIGQQQTMQDLANRLTIHLSRPVNDETALKAKYDFTLTFSQEGLSGPMGLMAPMPPPPPGGAAGGGSPAGTLSEVEPPPDLFSAMQAQLGLRLEPKKGPVGMIVIDHVEKTPTEN
jgi:uncharacterized protein (TIGR03435 family)